MNTHINAHKTFTRVHLIAPVIAACLAVAAGVASPAEKEGAAPPSSAFKNEADKRSYVIGVTVASQLRSADLAIDLAPFMRGMKDAYTSKKLLLNNAEFAAVLADFQKDQKTKLAAVMTEKRLKGKQDGDAFLATNKGKDGVVMLDSGLQYKVLKTGNGKKPTLGDTVICNYAGTLVDGKEFDSSYKRGHPATFPVNKVIKGWTEALLLMPVGSKWQLFIPPDLAYGEAGAGRDIGPNATLIFEVELVGVKDASNLDAKVGG